MPKKINALREKLLTCAREILVGRGYSELTIRAIATECGVVPGTIYNYFPSKEKLVESVMLEDWRARRAMLDVKMQEAGSALEAIRVLAEALLVLAADEDKHFESVEPILRKLLD